LDWFEKLTGFKEVNYEVTRSNLEVNNQTLCSKVNSAKYGIGEFEINSLETLRNRAKSSKILSGVIKTSIVTGDVRQMHQDNPGSLFQVASQFNLLEMASPNVTPEDGVTGYQYDKTQGPACAIAAGAATIYRNYFAPFQDTIGQTSTRQIDCLFDVGVTLSKAIKLPISDLWEMKNGYALCTQKGLKTINDHLKSLTKENIDLIRQKLNIGIHYNVEVTDSQKSQQVLVSQAFCSALPVAYSNILPDDWEPFALVVLEAAYEATLWTTVLNAKKSGSNVVFLTLLGGGAFGNKNIWICSAIRRAINLLKNYDLDIRFVSYGAPQKELIEINEEFK